MKISSFKRIIAEDFEKTYQNLVSKIAYPINLLMEQFSQAMANGITFSENLNVQVKDLSVTLDANGKIVGNVSFLSSLSAKSKGIFCIKVDNLTNPGLFPTGAPFIFFSETNRLITVNSITGLQAGNQYQIRIVSVG